MLCRKQRCAPQPRVDKELSWVSNELGKLGHRITGGGSVVEEPATIVSITEFRRRVGESCPKKTAQGPASRWAQKQLSVRTLARRSLCCHYSGLYLNFLSDFVPPWTRD